MVSKFKSIALVGALAFLATPVAVPAFAQDTGLPVIGQLPLVGQLPVVGTGDLGGLDLDPLHIFTPAAAPAAAPAPKVKAHHHHLMHHKKVAMHHKTMKKKS